MRFLCTMHRDIVAVGFDPIYLRCLKEIDAAGRFDYQPFEILVAGLQLLQQSQNTLVSATIPFAHDLLLRASPGNIKPLLIEWLEQVIKGVYLKRADGILIVGSDEDDVRERPLSEG